MVSDGHRHHALCRCFQLPSLRLLSLSEVIALAIVLETVSRTSNFSPTRSDVSWCDDVFRDGLQISMRVYLKPCRSCRWTRDDSFQHLFPTRCSQEKHRRVHHGAVLRYRVSSLIEEVLVLLATRAFAIFTFTDKVKVVFVDEHFTGKCRPPFPSSSSSCGMALSFTKELSMLSEIVGNSPFWGGRAGANQTSSAPHQELVVGWCRRHVSWS